jgi:hypothetical protein
MISFIILNFSGISSYKSMEEVQNQLQVRSKDSNLKFATVLISTTLWLLLIDCRVCFEASTN